MKSGYPLKEMKNAEQGKFKTLITMKDSHEIKIQYKQK